MTTSELIANAINQGRLTLNEAESKLILSHYDVPFVMESIVASDVSAVGRAREIGFPVVLKGLGARLVHKTERGLVKLNLNTDAEVRAAFREIKQSAGTDWEGCLIQPMIEGRREFVAGLVRDAQFGPVVMFGIGGIFAEALNDTAFRIAPVNRTQALNMLEDLSCRKLLYSFRGEAPADREQLVRVILALSRVAIDHPDIGEIDINPLIISADGKATAVDALIVIDPESSGEDLCSKDLEDRKRSRAVKAALGEMTRPRSIAIVGAKKNKEQESFGIIKQLVDFGYPGAIYPVNPNIDEISGYKAYPDLASLPERPDLVIVSVPAKSVPGVLRNCARLGSKNVHIFSSGFSETGEQEAAALHREIKSIALESELHVIGPNCMGMYVPEARLVTWPFASQESGPVAFVSQSGGNARDFTKYTVLNAGLHFSKVFSYGNALTLDSSDFLEFLAEDEGTEIICMYLEGVADGSRFLRLVMEINKEKPVIIIKAGLTESGARAVTSHTGALAGKRKIWEAFFRQSGAIEVESLEELADAALALLSCPECRGRGLAVIGHGGGLSVQVADECSRSGLELPLVSPAIHKRMREYIPPEGNMIRNPIDSYVIFFDLERLGETLSLLADQPDIHMFIISLHLDWLYGDMGRGGIEKIAAYLIGEAKERAKGKPLAVAYRSYQQDSEIAEGVSALRKSLLETGIPFYWGLPKAVRAFAKMAGYYEFKRGVY